MCGQQLRLLLWKNFTLRKRQPFHVIAELLLPLILFLLLTWVKLRGTQSHNHECHYDGKPMPSAGPLPFFQGLLCTATNTCHRTIRPSEIAGVVDYYNSSLMSQLFLDVQEVLKNESQIEAVSKLLEDIVTLQNMQEKAASGKLDCTFRLGDVLINTTELTENAKKQNISLSDGSLQTLLMNATLNTSQLLQLITTQSILSSKTPDISKNLQKQICKKEGQRFFLLPDTAELNAMTEQLCQLNDTQFEALVKDVREQVDIKEVMKQMTKCSEKTTGRKLEINSNIIQRNRELMQDLQGLGSLEKILKTSNGLFGNNNKDLKNDSATLSFVSRMFCGRESSMFRKVEAATSVLPTQDNDDKPLEYNYDNETTEFCNDLFRDLQKTTAGRIGWKQFKPMIRGWITYSPDTPAVRKIIKEANSTFEILARIKTASQDWMKISPNITKYLSSNPQVKQLKDSLETLALIYPNITAFDQFSKFLSNETNPDGSLDWRTLIHNMNVSMDQMKKYLDCFNFNKFKGYANESDLETGSMQLLQENTLWAGLVFDVDPHGRDLPTYISYKIRIDTDHVDTTTGKKVTDQFWVPGPRDSILMDLKYIQYGFVYIQDMIDHGIIRLQTEKNPKVGVLLQQFPYPCFIHDDFVRRIGSSIPLFMTIAWIFTASMIVKGIVYEKEQRLKEVMKVMGLTNGCHWLAWFITCFIMMFISVLLLLSILKFGKLLETSDMSVIFVFMIAYAVATISECFMFSVFFSKANVAATCAGIFYFIGYLPFSLCQQWNVLMTPMQKGAACLSSTVGFGFGWTYISVYEQMGIGMQWKNIAKSPMLDDKFNFLTCIMMMLFDAVIYGLITWYVEAVFPGQYGMPQPWYFFVTKSYWCSYDYSANKNLESANSLYNMSCTHEDRENFEDEPNNLTLGVSIRELRKVYKHGNKVAIDRLTINFYEGQVTSFLGHNGAGKTTTMSILTGLFPQTAGTAYIYGKDIRSDLNEIRKKMGMCPQYNVLFDMLTVEEHLWFYSRLKGMDNKSIEQEMPQMIQDVGLPHKQHELAKNLSGGMKRKMSVALAFAAGSKVVILDEPTAGVDPFSRKSIWDLVLKYKEGRTIIMSTHFMEEADILGDRIAILSQGKLCCCGSSLFLKNQFGSGYYLTVARDLATEEEDDDKKDTKDKAGKQTEVPYTVTDQGEQAAAMANRELGQGAMALTVLIHKFLPRAVLVEDMNSELTYQLPDDRHNTQLFQDLFIALDDNIKTLGFSSYGISDTTLEEVFLKVTETNELDSAETLDRLTDRGMVASPVNRRSFRRKHLLNLLGEKEGHSQEDGVESSSDAVVFESTECVIPALTEYEWGGSYKLSGFALMKIQFCALLVKRFHYMRRSKKGFLSQIILPVIFVCLAMVFSKITPTLTNEPPLEMHPWLLLPKSGPDDHLNMFFSNDLQDSSWTEKIDTLLTTADCAVGCRCMDPAVNQIQDFPCFPVKNGEDKWTYFRGDINETAPCSCSSGIQNCPAGAEGPEPPRKLLPTTDYLYNLTGRNISDWLVKTTDKYIHRRYGGISYGDENGMVQLNTSEFRRFLDGLLDATKGNTAKTERSEIMDNVEKLLSQLVTKQNGKVWFNNKGYQSSVAYMNIMNNALLRTNLPPGADPSKYGISVTNHPINRTQNQMTIVTLRASAVDVLISITVIFAMSFIPAGFVLFLTEERSSNSKHLQLVSGVKPAVYWVATFVWDMASFLVSAIICILIFVIFQQMAYVSRTNAPCLVTLILLYGWAITPLMYIGSYGFKVPSSSFVTLSCINVFVGIITTISTFILELFSDPWLDEVNNILLQVFLVLPQFCLGRGLIDMTRNQLISDVFATYGEQVFINPFDWDVVGRNLFSLFIQGFGYFLIVICMEYNFWISKMFKSQPPAMIPHHEDVDVARERQRVFTGNVHNDMLTIENLTKTYRGFHGKQHPAVDGICLGVHKGECFGLLGVNGAGKTTTFKMLTGDMSVTSGDAHLCGHSILTDIVSVHQHLGYCPQFDALCPLLTGLEHLLLYAQLRGVPAHEVPQAAKWALKRLNLMQHANKCVADYSGGNKRKLSTAIALVGNPSIVFLDEPSTGMDPKARRFLWKCISDITKSGRSVVLTSHSMEECEALCNRIAIMVNGTFQCLGSVQHLKNRFGNGYMVMLHIAASPSDEHKVRVIDFMTKTFPSAQLKEHHQNVLQYQLGSSLMSLAYIFGELEKARDWLHIEDYSVCQTTLDQVFINFARNQTDLVDDELRALVARNKQANGGQRQSLNVAGPHVRHLDNVLALGDTQNVYGNMFKMLPAESRPPLGEVNHNEVIVNEVSQNEVNHAASSL